MVTVSRYYEACKNVSADAIVAVRSQSAIVSEIAMLMIVATYVRVRFFGRRALPSLPALLA